MINLNDLVTPLTTEQVNETLLTTIEGLGVPARSWVKGRAMSVITRAAATLISALTLLISDAVKATFLDSSTGTWLTLLAYYVYGVTRIEATFATGSVRFDNGGGGSFVKAAGEVRVYNPTTKKTYVNTAAFTIAPLQTGVLVPFQAVESGSASSSAPMSVNAIETTMLGVTALNPLAIVGSDAERDPTLRQACRDKLATLSPNGPRAAYSYFSRRALRSDGTVVDINRCTVSRDSSTGIVDVYVASPAGAPAAADVTACADSCGANCVPDSVTLHMHAATNVTLAITPQIWARKELGGTTAEITQAAANALIALQRDYPIGGIKKVAGGGYLFADYVASAIIASHPAIFDVGGVTTDLALAAGQVAVIVPTFAVNIVSGAS